MNLLLKDILKNIIPKQKGLKKKVLSFSFFLLISTFFWFLNSLGENYNENLRFPIKYKNLPLNTELSQVLPEVINIKANISGYRYLEYLLNANKPSVVIDYKNSNLIRQRNKHHYLLSVSLVDKISKMLPDINIQTIKPDTINFYFDDVVSKLIPIKAQVNYTIKDGFVKKGSVFCRPDSVFISGPKEIVTKIKFINTGIINLGEISHSTKRNVALKKIKSVKYKTTRTNVHIPIEQSTERLLEVPITVDNLIDKDIIKLIPNHINLSFNVGLSEYENISPDMFVAEVVYSDSSKTKNVLKINLREQAKNVYDLNYTPKFVEFIKFTE